MFNIKTFTPPTVKPVTLTSKQFNKLKPEQKRVAIAQDALSTLELRNAPTLRRGAYFELCTSGKGRNRITDDKDLQELILANMKKCTVCAKGMMFLTHVKLADQIIVDDIRADFDDSDDSLSLDDADVCSPLSEYFDNQTLDMIEYIFEAGEAGYPNMDINTLNIWINNIDTPEDRFREICYNIIRNKGEFDPEDVSGFMATKYSRK